MAAAAVGCNVARWPGLVPTEHDLWSGCDLSCACSLATRLCERRTYPLMNSYARQLECATESAAQSTVLTRKPYLPRACGAKCYSAVSTNSTVSKYANHYSPLRKVQHALTSWCSHVQKSTLVASVTMTPDGALDLGSFTLSALDRDMLDNSKALRRVMLEKTAQGLLVEEVAPISPQVIESMVACEPDVNLVYAEEQLRTQSSECPGILGCVVLSMAFAAIPKYTSSLT